MTPEDRQHEMARLIARNGAQSVEALASRFGVSAETVRRDLGRLARSGVIQKVHGGARTAPAPLEGSFAERMAEDAEAKEVIAAKLAALVTPGETLFIDTGSTTLACARALRHTRGLTVVTNSVRIAQAFDGGDAQVILLGGTYKADNAQTVGPETLRQIAEFRADRAILTPAALDADGTVLDADLDEAQVARAMHRHARSTVIVAAASKLGRRAPHRVCGVAEIATLLTETLPEGDFARVLAQADVKTS
jgi:DeoR family transcriptional regulator, glycerol-3-phosphate regulon repressor